MKKNFKESARKTIRAVLIVSMFSPFVGLYFVLTEDLSGRSVCEITEVNTVHRYVKIKYIVDSTELTKEELPSVEGYFDQVGQMFELHYDLDNPKDIEIQYCSPTFASGEATDTVIGKIQDIYGWKKPVFGSFWLFKPGLTYIYSVEDVDYLRHQSFCVDGAINLSRYKVGDSIAIIFWLDNPNRSIAQIEN